MSGKLLLANRKNMIVQTLDDVAIQTYYRLVNLLNMAALTIGMLNRAKASLLSSQIGLSYKDFFHNRLREFNLPKDFTIARGMNAATYAFSAGLDAYYKVKKERFVIGPHFIESTVTTRLAQIAQAFVASWVEHIQ
jgi:hypothetical protein